MIKEDMVLQEAWWAMWSMMDWVVTLHFQAGALDEEDKWMEEKGV